MRLESALFASREGLTANGQAVAVVGDNISNANTTAFKTARAEFADLISSADGDRVSEVIEGAGDGVAVSGVRIIQEPGIVETTGRDLDVGISGGGFFMVGDSVANASYTRNGSFEINNEGFLTGPQGKTVLGYQGTDTATLTPIDMKVVNTAGAATSSIQLFGNLDSASTSTTAPTNPTSFKDLGKNASYQATTSVFDSLGARHEAQLYFYKTDAGTWTAQAYLDGSDVGGTAGVPVQLGAAVTLNFNGTGTMDEASKAAAVITATPAYSNGATAGNFAINLGSFTQYAGGSLVNNVVQDGEAAGNITNYQVNQDGKLFAVLDTGTRALLGTIPLASFNNMDGLQRSGSSLYTPTPQAGAVKTGTAGEGLLGTLEARSLERSTVDIAEQFVNLLLFQRGYQANSQVLNNANQMIRDTLGLIR